MKKSSKKDSLIDRSWFYVPLLMGLALLAAFAGFALFLLCQGVSPLPVFAEMLRSALFNSYGLSETVLKTVPIVFTAYSVSFAYAGGLVTLGGEGQMNIGAIGATVTALYLPPLPTIIIIPLMFVVGGFLAGLWGGVAGMCKSWFDANETIITLLMNYVALLLVKFLVFGVMRSPDSLNFPQSRPIPSAAMMPDLGLGRVHPGILVALGIGVIIYFVLERTRAGFDVRVIGKNLKVARYRRLNVGRTWILLMFFSGCIAGLAGVCEVSAVQGRLRPDISIGLGYTGFLVSWLARHNLFAIPPVAFFVAAIISSGDSLQIFAGLPYATVEVLQGMIFLAVLLGEFLIRENRDRLQKLVDGV